MPNCKLTLDSKLFEKFSLHSAEISSFLEYYVKVYPLTSKTQLSSLWLKHDKVLTTHQEDIIKISSFLKCMAKIYGPLRIYGFRLINSGLSIPDAKSYPDTAYYTSTRGDSDVDTVFVGN